MDDLAAQLSQILADPQQMAQIAQIANSLGLGADAPPEAPAAAAAPPEGGGPELEALGRLLPLLSQASGREAQVLGALKPYLKPEDQQRADRALRAAKLSRLAQLALRELGNGGLGGLL